MTLRSYHVVYNLFDFRIVVEVFFFLGGGMNMRGANTTYRASSLTSSVRRPYYATPSLDGAGDAIALYAIMAI